MNIPFLFSGVLAFSFLTALACVAQSSSQQACPRVSVSCPSSFNDGEPIKFEVAVVGGNPTVVPSYNWTVHVGRIIEGQGTPSIKVDTKGFGRTFTATVSIAGLDPGCPTTASCSILPGTPVPPAMLFDRYYPKSAVMGAPKKLRARRRAIRQR
jgi:hypothetical protein